MSIDAARWRSASLPLWVVTAACAARATDELLGATGLVPYTLSSELGVRAGLTIATVVVAALASGLLAFRAVGVARIVCAVAAVALLVSTSSFLDPFSALQLTRAENLAWWALVLLDPLALATVVGVGALASPERRLRWLVGGALSVFSASVLAYVLGAGLVSTYVPYPWLSSLRWVSLTVGAALLARSVVSNPVRIASSDVGSLPITMAVAAGWVLTTTPVLAVSPSSVVAPAVRDSGLVLVQALATLGFALALALLPRRLHAVAPFNGLKVVAGALSVLALLAPLGFMLARVVRPRGIAGVLTVVGLLALAVFGNAIHRLAEDRELHDTTSHVRIAGALAVLSACAYGFGAVMGQTLGRLGFFAAVGLSLVAFGLLTRAALRVAGELAPRPAPTSETDSASPTGLPPPAAPRRAPIPRPSRGLVLALLVGAGTLFAIAILVATS